MPAGHRHRRNHFGPQLVGQCRQCRVQHGAQIGRAIHPVKDQGRKSGGNRVAHQGVSLLRKRRHVGRDPFVTPISCSQQEGNRGQSPNDRTIPGGPVRHGQGAVRNHLTCPQSCQTGRTSTVSGPVR